MATLVVAAAVSLRSLLSSLPLPRPSLASSPPPPQQKSRRSAPVAFAGPPTTGRRSRGPPAPEESDPIAPKSDNNGFLPQEDLDYLWKLAAGSVGGGAIIKYGSALFPEITRPNILQALLMIGIPVVVSVFLLMKESASNNQN